ncbi:hypothetical protein EN759_04125 [Mesorhizobium sp. M00.F.Ca.ET.038.03.1.1]|nr:hypothetical protein EN759_04125 [Mesorhizobium sp. M00.F.Ca.ET.038.03.1.1]TIW04388.1 MAG: hypothetical protein E5V77_00705 [Mesorhizobium sp.]
MVAEIVHPDLGKRLVDSCDGNPEVPPINFGRLKWFVEQLEKHGVKVAAETVRKWFAGETMPRQAAAKALAQILKVDEGWLLTGKSPDFSELQLRTHNRVVGGAVNLVAGFIQLASGSPSFPEDDDALAKANQINLYAIIKGAHYRLHVTGIVGEKGGYFFVPNETRNGTIVLGVVPIGQFQVAIYELDWPTIEKEGSRKVNGYEVRLSNTAPFKEIRTFAERL